MTTTTTLAARLVARLREMGIDRLFGVPADYNLAFLEEVYAAGLEFTGNCNELNAAYAADGYARLRGAAALLTTFGVGELSAVNGIGGSYAESVPVVEIVGAPATTAAAAGLPMHHTMADGDFLRFERLHAEVTVDRVTLTADGAAEEMDRVLRACLTHRRPVRIALPADLVLTPVPAATAPLMPVPPAADPEVTAAFADAAARLITPAARVAVVADHLVERFGARETLAALVAAGSLPVAVMPMGKGVVDESGPTFAGVYVGAASGAAARAAVEEADCLVAAGVLVSDGNTAGFTHAFPPGRTIEVGPARTRIGDGVWELTLPQALDVLTGLVKDRPAAAPDTRQDAPAAPPAPAAWLPAPDTALTQAALWDAVSDFLRPGDVVVAEQGTSFFGIVERRLPADCRFVGQVLWSSIGYTLPAALGTALADPARRTVLFIGDGSLQLTAQELGTMARTGAGAVVVVVNNGGYSIERAIRPTTAPYNDIAPWSYADLLAAFGAPEAFSVRVRTEDELAAALPRAAAQAAAGRPALVEVVVGPEDFPGRLAGIAAKYRAR